MTLLGPAEIRALAATAGIRPAKALGQSFVVDPNTIRRLVRLADLPAGSHVLEVGPGLGSLTLGLLGAGHRVTAVEIDARLAGLLPATVAEHEPGGIERMSVLTADAGTLRPEQVDPDALVANLPYNVAVPVLLHCLATFPRLRRTLVMVQAEVADRLAAPSGSRTYGAPSVKVRWFGTPRRVGSVSPRVFWPVPRVDSGLVAIDAVAPPDTEVPRAEVFARIDRCFGQRRKMLRSILAQELGAGAAAHALRNAGLAGDSRPERLDLPDFVRLAEALATGPPIG